ncbi:esterase/lipase family protein [Maribellus sediminis]|uniref:esterase/lipase family protein n=1 Tax=Maribellus sediminis TaxID=2696285 RepID=UPI00142F929F|nr:phospholipase [Maribellus sediminis]
MAELKKINLVFVHGYSVTNLNTYGELPVRLKAEGAAQNFEINVEEIYLGQYISFNDEVKLDDISRAFEYAVKEQLAHLLNANERFVCITHSTGGPLIRNWWSNYYYNEPDSKCPMSHLIMLAPANFGSALAQLGKGKISRLKSWVEGVEPGQGVLNWLELGSAAAWELNHEWINAVEEVIGSEKIFPFVLTGQSIDRKFYDHLNSYTGELGSDGVVRVSAANLNAQYIKLVQGTSEADSDKLFVEEFQQAQNTAFRIISGKSHSGTDMGIMASVKKRLTDKKSNEIIKAIFDCINVTSKIEYDTLFKSFSEETTEVQKKELKEIHKGAFKRRTYLHHRFSQVIFKVCDSDGSPISDYDLLFTGPDNDPNHLPEGFLSDRQRNRINKETVTYYFNYDKMLGRDINGKPTQSGTEIPKQLGILIRPRPTEGFIRFKECKLEASREYLDQALKPNSTTLLEIVLNRNVDTNVFRLNKLEKDAMPSKKAGDFKDIKPSNENVD